MRLIVLCFVSLAIFSGSCIKKSSGCPYSEGNTVAPASEQQAVLDYLTNNSITATKHSSGMYYQVVAQGSGGAPHLCSQIVVAYSGTLTSGMEFDASSNLVYDLGALIEGWKKGIPLIEKGGHILLYIPPSLGYGASDVKDGNGVTIIPGNSILIFDITLKGFN